MKRTLILAGAAISVVVLGILTNIATNLLPEGYLPPPWIVWTALIVVALSFIIFTFWQERVSNADKPPSGRAANTSSNLKNLRQRYLQHLIDAYQYLEFKGIIQFEKLPLRMSLEKVYVNLWAQPELPTGETLKEELRLAGRKVAADKEMLLDDELELMVERARPVQVDEALAEHPALVILGDPGSGKSTLLKHLALAAARNFDKGKRLPILLPLAAYAHALQANSQLSLHDFLPEFYKGMQEFPENPASLFYDALASGNTLILLDGLDEVHDPSERSRVVHHVKNFYLNHRHAANQFVITSRIVGYREAPLEADGVFHLTLLDFSKEQISQFVENWCRTYEIAQSGETPKAWRDAEGEKSKLLKAILNNAGVEKLAANPLLLTILALIHRQGTELPNRRAELYELYLTTLIKTWNRARSLAGMSVGSMDDKETVKILAPLAYWMHANRPSGTARRTELEREIARHFTERRKLAPEDAEREATRFLDDVRQYSGLLAERGPDAYGFVHLTFEEYLAARHIVFQGQVNEQKSLELLRKHAYDPAWREVILLALGYLGLIANEEEKTALFVRGLLNDQPPTNHLGENVELAGSALKDIGRVSVGEDCWKEVIDRLLTTMTNSAPTIIVRAKCGDVLGELGDPRLEKMEWCEVPEGEFLMGCTEDELKNVLDEMKEFYQAQSWNFVMEDARKWRQESLPQHSVFLRRFYVGMFPITNQEFRVFKKSGGYQEARWWNAAGIAWLSRNPEDEEEMNLDKWQRRNGRTEPAFWDDTRLGIPNRPVVGVTWFEAMAFCAWLNERLQLARELLNGYVARLPIEAEWEKAARGNDGRFWPWGNHWNNKCANTYEANLLTTSSVGIFSIGASPYGALDMAGNTKDWCHSLLAPYPYDPEDGRENIETHGKRAVRGGLSYTGQYSARCTHRRHHSPDFHYDSIGFRVVIGPKLG
ncbi:SUMF1/EgtB/PvdO family nonheme iron enzyme [candidate division KSB1 bacterium]|nr:SUMF1/EgtB/PvdO family nonheme iron enzyme [candidate division KSB1 bacterium]